MSNQTNDPDPDQDLQRLSFDQLRNRISERINEALDSSGISRVSTSISPNVTFDLSTNRLSETRTGLNSLSSQVDRIVMIVDEISLDNSRSVNLTNRSSYNKAIISEPSVSFTEKLYTCYHCSKSFGNTKQFIEHLNLCKNDNDQNECSICLNRIETNKVLIQCHGCKKCLGCKSCINNMVGTIGTRKLFNKEKIDNETITFCSIKCPMCRKYNNIRLDVYEPKTNISNDIIIHNIKTFIKQNPNRKTIDKQILLEFIDQL